MCNQWQWPSEQIQNRCRNVGRFKFALAAVLTGFCLFAQLHKSPICSAFIYLHTPEQVIYFHMCCLIQLLIQHFNILFHSRTSAFQRLLNVNDFCRSLLHKSVTSNICFRIQSPYCKQLKGQVIIVYCHTSNKIYITQ